MIRQFVEIGYINDPGDNPQEAIKSTERENRWALAQSYLSAARYTDALPLLESVYEEWPERWDFCSELALGQLNLGLVDEAHETVSGIIENQTSPSALLLRANIEYRRKNFAQGLEYLAQAEALVANISKTASRVGKNGARFSEPCTLRLPNAPASVSKHVAKCATVHARPDRKHKALPNQWNS